MTNTERMNRLSAKAASVLAAMGSSKIGAVVPLAEIDSMRAELAALDIIGSNDGLTIKGSAVACVLQSELLDRMFG